MQAAVSHRPATGRRRGGSLPPLAVAAAAVLISTALPVAAYAEPAPQEEAGHPRITTVDRTEGLDPEGDTVTVSGIGHTPGSVIEIATLALPPEAAGAAPQEGGEAVTDTENTVEVRVGEHGAFSAALVTGAAFAAAAGLDAADDAFEIRLVEVDPADPAAEPVTGTWGGDAPAADAGDAGEPVRAPGAGMSAPVLAPASPAAAVVGRIPVAFAVPEAAPVPESRPQTAPQALAGAPQAPAPREPGNPRITVSKTEGLDPAGETVTVTGTGYDTSKGIYVALCDTADAGPTRAPTPCIGGVDMDGSGGASAWISSNPPPYGEGLAVAYSGSGTDGGFSVEITVKADDGTTDCNDPGVECAVVTRNDHTRSSDRGQDHFVPVSFSDGPGSGGDGGGGSTGAGDGGSGNGGSGNGGSGGSGGSGNGGGGSGPTTNLPRTGTELTVLVLAAAVAAATGAFALFATRRRRTPGTDAPDAASA
ncbi:LPXTG-motif cell wall anchor domain-containing protein [Nocardiopsis flavescens]|uniref:LPXTG-motif cell wall anchor domain-containing protein n=1 Tax=Nocardiopsis flavescens TaxID=758803 RepID=A0A1M6K2H9_9ACTN|nr:LPXTG cell wall anchor domain-containing protein [Nocardiopsis flavescens]SHJ53117.1 LPXTG-motif cell wall anchor domain-containing protein [Nocardiopsis flavescens]